MNSAKISLFILYLICIDDRTSANLKNIIKYSIEVTFSLQKSADKIDNQEAINSGIFVVDKYYDSNHEDFAGRYISEDTDATEQDSLTDALLKVLRDIVTPNTHCNCKIYGGKDTKEEHFLKDFRA